MVDATLVTLALALAIGWITAIVVSGWRARESLASTTRWLWGASIGVGAWLAYSGWLGLQGRLLDVASFPPPMIWIVLPMLVISFAVAFSPIGKRLARGLSYAELVGFQSFRIIVELLLFEYFKQGRLPVQMTFAGRNWDVISGVTAGLIGLWAWRGVVPKKLILGWNLLGLGLLCNIVMIAILSVPGQFRIYTNEPANELVLHFPYVWIPAVFVMSALLGHLLVFRKLAASSGIQNQSPRP